MNAAELVDYVRTVVDEAPPLTDDLRVRITSLLKLTSEDEVGALDRRRADDRAERAAADDAEAAQIAAQIAADERDRAARARTAIYRHFDADGVLLYVGVTVETSTRRAAHRRTAPWVRFHDHEIVEWLPTREQALEAEALAIAAEQPIFNKQGAALGAQERRLRYLIDHEAWDMVMEKAL